eukprot:symbB.v1.2.039747.t1/scaffold6763.1/size17768/2
MQPLLAHERNLQGANFFAGNALCGFFARLLLLQIGGHSSVFPSWASPWPWPRGSRSIPDWILWNLHEVSGPPLSLAQGITSYRTSLIGMRIRIRSNQHVGSLDKNLAVFFLLSCS